MDRAPADDLVDILTLTEPLGPLATEDILSNPEVFLELYERKAELTSRLNRNRPAYVIGRKGAGKTAFLIGEILSSRDNQVVSIKAGNAFAVMNNLRLRWEDRHGTLPVDHLVFLWEAVLVHSAMRGSLILAERGDATRLNPIAAYLQSVAPQATLPATGGAAPGADTEAQFLDALSQQLWKAIDADDSVAAVADMVGRLGTPQLNYARARVLYAEMLSRRRGRLCVVVDNLEDLGARVDGLESVLAGLFRIVSRVTDPLEPIRLPFDLRFAFPAELTRRLRTITANPEKDFKNRIVVHWTASELIELAEIRLRKSLQIHFRDSPELRALLQGDARPGELVRAVLPEHFTNGLGLVEDPVAYVMRHTQLLPRHLIQILNEVLSPMFRGGSLRRVSGGELLEGTREAEKVIREGVLSSYLNDYPWLGDGLARLQNQLSFSFSQDELSKAFQHAGLKRATGQRYDEFLWAAVAAGVIGIVDRATDRYIVGDFAYTFPDALRPLADDRLCLHPLFVHLLNDRRALRRLRERRERPVYPYGTGLGEADADP